MSLTRLRQHADAAQVAGVTVALLAVWALLWLIAPTLLVSTNPGLQTALQVLPASFLALLALAFGAAFVVVQQAGATLTTRSGVLLLQDNRVVVLIAVTLELTAATLLVAGQVPASGTAPETITAAVSTLMAAAALLVVAYAVVIPRVVRAHTVPVTVVNRLLARLKAAKGEPDDDLASLGEIERHALARHDEAAYRRCIEGIAELLGDSETSAPVEPLGRHLANAAEAAVAVDGPLFEADVLLEHLQASAQACVGRPDLASRLIVALARLGTRTEPPARAADLAGTAEALAGFVAHAEDKKSAVAAATGLSMWGMARARAEKLDATIAQEVEATRSSLGSSPPYADAVAAVGEPGWGMRWPDVAVNDVLVVLQAP
jgi:hypothetical protein